jgi:hypothetical protein
LAESSRKLRALDAAAPLGVTVTGALEARRYQTGRAADPNLIVNADPAGTRTTIDLPVHDEAFATTVPNLTVPGFPKPLPRRVTFAPTTPWVGDSERSCTPDAGGTGGVVGGRVVVVVGGRVVVVVGGRVVVGGTVVGGTVVGGTVVGGTVVGGTVVGGTVVGGTVVGGTVVGGTVVGGTVTTGATVIV